MIQAKNNEFHEISEWIWAYSMNENFWSFFKFFFQILTFTRFSIESVNPTASAAIVDVWLFHI